MVDIQVEGKPVSIFCPKYKLSRSDVAVEMLEDQLSTVFQYLEEDCQELEETTPRRRGRKRRRPPSEPKGSQEDAESEAEGVEE